MLFQDGIQLITCEL